MQENNKDIVIFKCQNVRYFIVGKFKLFLVKREYMMKRNDHVKKHVGFSL